VSNTKELNDYIIEILSPFGAVRLRAMFGGHGVYLDGLFVAIIVNGTLYFKTDEKTRPLFIEKACRPFAYELKGKRVSMSYYEAPSDAVDSSDAIEPWLKLAKQAAMRARSK
jgi:DNA transformation protein